ncbi:MAG: efflux RND transporter periplasmic adaptor subunit [Chitinophagaceae bacterium]|nr:efflux RND transporter periplasmic adaptor subunit [Chitinophagaceae bacterium]MCW5928093.1 efflux RND transporter periplasmic adaptor subunit [Chitinophagaceae bacterium]
MKKNRKFSIIRIIITTVVIIAALAGVQSQLNKNKAANQAATDEVAKKNTAVSVRTDTARMKDIDLTYTANGTFIPRQEVIIGAEVGGRVANVYVKEGDFVRPGQTLATIVGHKQNVSVANAEANLNNAKMDLERFENAFATGGVTRQQLDGVRLQFETAKNNLKSAQLAAGDIAIKTSVAGIVNSKKIEPGSYVSAGTAAFDVVNISSLKLKVNVDEKNIAGLKTGQTVDVLVSVMPDKTFSGKITFIAPKADANLNFPVEIEIPNTKNELRAGMYGSAKFGQGTTTHSLVVPRTAFVGSVSDNRVFILEDGKAVEKKVQAGRSFGNDIEVLDGLAAGDPVIISGQINIFDQTPVQAIR